ncbi:hypothetical protein E2C01_019124 [Portunus trituberculatus]|uniref:Uncharacterized protein n=1 Tax=Portunus trituberculatus TaxID=210409 RepID=A0A5B7DY68_PORTR|nr:hypothetical protein [Portunus trituberculatus]
MVFMEDNIIISFTIPCLELVELQRLPWCKLAVTLTLAWLSSAPPPPPPPPPPLRPAFLAPVILPVPGVQKPDRAVLTFIDITPVVVLYKGDSLTLTVTW